ncbi:ABC transporter permease [Agromyces sp. SYSU T00194]|uniref:ABC transporter permease n=1 Tax=Agromyces chitinivorans TaxID=3158560 RepID=UPI00339472C3
MAVDTPKPPSVERPRTSIGRAFHSQVLLSGATATFAVLVLLAAFAPLITPYDPVQADLSATNQPPSSAHWFGTDTQGMDVFTRVLYAARTDLLLSVSGIVVALLLGLVLGSVAAYFGGWVDEVLSRIAEMFQAIPLFLFALMVIAALGNGGLVLAGIIAVFYTPAFFKVARSVAAPLLQADFVAVARTAGRTGFGVIVQHIAPNSVGPLLSQFSINTGFAIQVIAGLSFLGLGVPIPEPEWGAMIAIGAPRIAYGQWWMAFFPGLAVFVTVIALDGIGRRISDWGTR